MHRKVITILVILIVIILAGCNPVEPIPEPVPVTSIRIVPAYSEIDLGESVELACIDQLDRPVIATWSKRCGAGSLSQLIGETCVYTTPRTMAGIQEIYADFEGLRATARVNGIKK